MAAKSIAERALEQGQGILRLKPAWVPRVFCIPGRRIKLHPDDYYALGGNRGGLDERWFASTTPADNGPLTSPNEGLSFVVFEDGAKTQEVLLRDAVAELKDEILGTRIWKQHKRWPMYSKFFDNLGPLPHHIHHSDKFAAKTGQLGKPEAYFFPPQLNNHPGQFPHTYFGFDPDVTREEVKARLARWETGDTRITELSRAYRLQLGTGWYVPDDAEAVLASGKGDCKDHAVLFDLGDRLKSVCLYELTCVHGSSRDMDTQLALDFVVLVDEEVDGDAVEYGGNFKVPVADRPKLIGETLALTGGTGGRLIFWSNTMNVAQAAIPQSIGAEAMPDKETCLKLYSRMLLIRRAEECLARLSQEGKFPGAVHLYIGQEAVAAGV